MSEVRVVLTTAPDDAVARTLAHTLVDEGWVACASLVPGVSSIYRWEGSVRTDAEILLVLKCSSDRLAGLQDRLSELHPYEVPEFLALPVVAGLPAYLRWVVGEGGE